MSALDKAFIKACRKDAGPVSAGSRDHPAGTPTSGRADCGEMLAAATDTHLSGATAGYRIDGAHAEPPVPHRTPQDASPGSPGAVEHEGYYPQAAPPQIAVLAAPERQQSDARRELGSPTPSSAAESPASQNSPASSPSPGAADASPLKLGSIFAPSEPAPAPDAPQAFIADWEVDGLVWPAICERLLETEARYFRSVGQRLKEATRDQAHVVMITGARRGEGRTTLTLCLARCAAQAGVKVAVVDADLQNPQLGIQLGIETPCGWLEVVAGKTPLNEAAVVSLEDGLTLFPLTGADGVEMQAGDPRWTAVLRSIATHFALVIVDTGPLSSGGQHPFSTDGNSPIDTAIVVRDLRNTSEKKTLATAALLQRSGVPAVGIAENFRNLETSEGRGE
jgi:Mrp family chromosome partitioning ATPase